MSQTEKVIEQLKENGFVSRNWALQNYISRLGAIICNLKKEGWKFRADYYKTQWGKDFRYYVEAMPDNIPILQPKLI